MQDCWEILLDHPLSYALTATTDVPVVYLQQFWRIVSKLLVENIDNPFVALVNIKTIEVFMNKVGCQGVVDKIHIPLRPYLRVLQYTTGDVRIQGMLIPNAFLTEEIRATDDFKEYQTVFMKVDVIMNQQQPVVSTQRTHRSTPRAHRTPTLTLSPQEKKRKQSARKSSSPHKSLKITIRQQKVVKENKDDDDSENRLEPESHKEKLEYIDDDDEKGVEKVDKAEGGEMGILEARTEETQTTIPTPPRSYRTNMERKCVRTKQFWKNKQVNQVLHLGVSQLAEQATEELIENNLKPCIAAVIIEDRDAFRSEVPDLVSQEFNAHAPKIIEDHFKNYEVLKRKFEMSSTSNTSCRDDNIHSHHDDHQEDDAPPEGEKRVKRQKASKSSKSAREETVIDEDEVILEDETPELITELQDVDIRIPIIFDYERTRATLNDALSNQLKNAEKYAYHLEQTMNFMENQIVWESRQEDIRRPVPKPLVFFGPQRNPNKPPRYLYNKDMFFLKYGNTEEKKYIMSLHKIHAEHFLEVDLEEKMNR
uniref:Uncharacterized protein n=1 Tax=Tanacetum cinerariifolium TaxID=118510 RepID=A0A6L2JSV8_TANCI|nr:hypothetical protein [Tanacetum cinerariifolium]